MEVRRGAPIRQVAPRDSRSPWNAGWRVVWGARGGGAGALGPSEPTRRRKWRARSGLDGVGATAKAKSSCSRERAGAGRGGSVGSPRAAKDLAHDHRVGELCDEAARAAAEGAGEDVDGEDSSQ